MGGDDPTWIVNLYEFAGTAIGPRRLTGKGSAAERRAPRGRGL